MAKPYSSIDGGGSVTPQAKTTSISAYPDLPQSASTILYFLRQAEQNRAIKSAPPITNLTTQNQTPINTSASVFFKEFEYFNARALSTILREDVVNGQNIKYSPITNLSNISIAYNPKNLIALQSTLQSYFDAFEINLDKYIPVAEEPTEEYTATETSAEYEVSISFANVVGNERVEVEFLVMDTAFNDTMYT